MCAEAGDFYPRVCGTEGIELLSARKRPICTLKPEFFFLSHACRTLGLHTLLLRGPEATETSPTLSLFDDGHFSRFSRAPWLTRFLFTVSVMDFCNAVTLTAAVLSQKAHFALAALRMTKKRHKVSFLTQVCRCSRRKRLYPYLRIVRGRH